MSVMGGHCISKSDNSVDPGHAGGCRDKPWPEAHVKRLDAVGLKRGGVQCMRQPTLEEGEQLRAPPEHVRVRRVLQPHVKRVGERPARARGAEGSAHQDSPRILLGGEALGPHEAHGELGAAAAQLKPCDSTISIQPMGVAPTTALKASRANFEEFTFQAYWQLSNHFNVDRFGNLALQILESLKPIRGMLLARPIALGSSNSPQMAKSRMALTPAACDSPGFCRSEATASQVASCGCGALAERNCKTAHYSTSTNRCTNI
mmetsp:Transcript_136070/g.434430  ORF Transcript_136070/g.434430 Transcript_136070/m.434430 type:complete len:261 (-) Transcript_136070:205-987(-)